jgi:hypothetical protein
MSIRHPAPGRTFDVLDEAAELLSDLDIPLGSSYTTTEARKALAPVLSLPQPALGSPSR